jgi:hypothetical protein
VVKLGFFEKSLEELVGDLSQKNFEPDLIYIKNRIQYFGKNAISTYESDLKLLKREYERLDSVNKCISSTIYHNLMTLSKKVEDSINSFNSLKNLKSPSDYKKIPTRASVELRPLCGIAGSTNRRSRSGVECGIVGAKHYL